MPKRARNGKYTIGFLAGYASSAGGFQDKVWYGMVEAARLRDLNVLVFAGGAIDFAPYNPLEKNLNTVYDLINKEQIDGLIINRVIGAFIAEERFQEFCRKTGLPIVTVLGASPGLPSVRTAGKEGMRDVVRHAIDHHHFTKIAFIKGMAGYPDAEERFDVYREELAKKGIPYKPDLVYQGSFDVDSGKQAALQFLALKDKRPDIIIAANDTMAFGALEELHRRGIRVPQDIAITGFDDTNEAVASAPPLTTVKQPFIEIIAEASDLLVDIIEGRKTTNTDRFIPAQIVVRQSCGCHSAIIQEAEAAGREKFTSVHSSSDSRREEDEIAAITRELVEACCQGEDEKTLAGLAAAFVADVQNRRPGGFMNELRPIFQDKIVHGKEIMPWYRLLYILRRWIPMLCPDEESRHNAETRILQASVLIGEASSHAMQYRQLTSEKNAKELTDAVQELITTFDFERLKLVTQRQMLRLKVPSYFISMFRDPQNTAAGSDAFLAMTDEPGGGDTSWTAAYATHSLPADSFFTAKERFACAVHPLFFGEFKLGYVLFELGPEEGGIYDALQSQISSSVMGSELINRMQDAETESKERTDIIQKLVRPMLDSLSAVTRTAREKIGVIGELSAMTKENSEKLTTTNSTIKSMNDKIVRILDVINLIDEISVRVNILAINTSIEATHAGQFGRGFAIIAGEIRKLGDLIKENAAVIGDSLKDIQPAIDSSRKAGGESLEAFRRLEKDVINVAQTLQKIADAMGELSATSAQILKTMDA